MPLKAWQKIVVHGEQAAIAGLCIWLLSTVLAPRAGGVSIDDRNVNATASADAVSFKNHTVSPHEYLPTTDMNGDSTRQGHAIFQLVFLILSNFSMSNLVCAVPKRRVLYMTTSAPVVQMLLASDTIWKCVGIQACYKLAGALLIVQLTAVMRKLAARLDGSRPRSDPAEWKQTTMAQRVFFGVYFANFVAMAAFPGTEVLAIIEMATLGCFGLTGWWHFLAYLLVSRDAFSTVNHSFDSSSEHTNNRTAAAVRARRTAKYLRRNMCMSLLFIHFTFVLAVLASPLWRANPQWQCRMRSNEDVLEAVESARFYVCDVLFFLIILGIWQTIFIFKAKKRVRKIQAKSAVYDHGDKRTKEGSKNNSSDIGHVDFLGHSRPQAMAVFKMILAVCDPVRFERVCYRIIRKESADKRSCAASLGLMVIVMICLPLMDAG